MQVILGVIFHFIGGFASGSFYMPYKKVKGWHWESYWIIGGIFSWLIVPPLAACLTIPGFTEIIKAAPLDVIKYTFLFGVLWGIGGLTYGLGVRYLGVSLGSSIILGLCMVFGSLIPSIYYDVFPAEGKDTFTMLISSNWGLTVLLGLAVCILGIIVCGKAGVMKEKQLSNNGATSDGHGGVVAKTEYKFALGMLVSIISGGNVDMYLLGQVVAKGLMQTGRMIKLFIELTDKPGALKNIVDEIARANVNIVEVVHDRLSSNISAGTAGVYLSLELENKEQSHILVKLFDKHHIKYKLIS